MQEFHILQPFQQSGRGGYNFWSYTTAHGSDLRQELHITARYMSSTGFFSVQICRDYVCQPALACQIHLSSRLIHTICIVRSVGLLMDRQTYFAECRASIRSAAKKVGLSSGCSQQPFLYLPRSACLTPLGHNSVAGQTATTGLAASRPN